jgi:hypothetical protein
MHAGALGLLAGALRSSRRASPGMFDGESLCCVQPTGRLLSLRSDFYAPARPSDRRG